MDITVFSQIAKFLSPPLIIVGLGLTLLFGLYKGLIEAGIVSKPSAAVNNKIVLLLFNHGLIVVLVPIILGFGLLFFDTWLQHRQPQAPVTFSVPGQEQLVRLGGNAEGRGFRLAVTGFDADGPSPEAKKALAAVADTLHAGQDLRAALAGHCSGQADSEGNRQLAEQWANQARGELIRLGIAPARLEAKGSERPPADNLSPQRVEVFLSRGH